MCVGDVSVHCSFCKSVWRMCHFKDYSADHSAVCITCTLYSYSAVVFVNYKIGYILCIL